MKIPNQCFECDQGHYEEITRDYTDVGPDGASVVIPGVKLLRCTYCGEELIPAESDRYISRFVAEATEQLTRAELFAMLEASGLTQKDFAEAIGLGEKTFHRWLKGTQVASRSMGYYLRALSRFPEAFKWVEERKWREPVATAPTPTKATKDQAVRFPALAGRDFRLPQARTNPARGFSKVHVAMVPN